MSRLPESPISRAEMFLVELEKPRDPRERGAWAIDHQRQFKEIVRDLLSYHAGFAQEQEALSSLAARLLVAIAPLLSMRPDGRHFIDDYVEGMAPRLRKCVADLRAFLNK